MKNRKINLDRPTIDSKEIQAGMNFGLVMTSYQVMSKPFYKSNWFFGTAGLASIGLIVGGTFAFQSTDESDKLKTAELVTDAPPEVISPDNNMITLNSVQDPVNIDNETVLITQKQVKHDKINTPIVEISDEIIQDINGSNQTIDQSLVEDTDLTNQFNELDLSPRINGKLHGDITREDLFDNRGITAGSDLSIIHFELHLMDGLGGKVFEEESNQLNQEMKSALRNITKGETIYFENIKGKTSDGNVVRLNPLRYVLLN